MRSTIVSVPFDAQLVDSSELPESLVSCIVAAVRSLRGSPGTHVPARIAYVTLR